MAPTRLGCLRRGVFRCQAKRVYLSQGNHVRIDVVIVEDYLWS